MAFRFATSGTKTVANNISDEDDREDMPPHLASKLKIHQVDGVRFLMKKIMRAGGGCGAILADEMGLGKTLQIICMIILYIALRLKDSNQRAITKVLIVVPVSLIDNWMAEFKRWSQLSPLVLGSKDTPHSERRLRVLSKWAEEGGVLIVGYEYYM